METKGIDGKHVLNVKVGYAEEGEQTLYPAGNLYGCQNKGVTEFDGCKCMKGKEGESA